MSPDVGEMIKEIGRALAEGLVVAIIAYFGWDEFWRRRRIGSRALAQARLEERYKMVAAARDTNDHNADQAHLTARAAYVQEYIVEALYYFVVATAVAVLTYFLYLVAATTNEGRDQAIEVVIYIFAGFSAFSYLGALWQVWQAKSFLHDVYNFNAFETKYKQRLAKFENVPSADGVRH
jgi:hypothetical protein